MLLLGSLPGCWSTAPSDPGTFTLAPGGSASYGALAIRFIGVESDSRCPAAALCIQQGDAEVRLEATVRRQTTPLTLRVNDPERRRIAHRGYLIELTALEPYPFSTDPIPAADYRVTLVISGE
jgi:hypothetical protein